MITWKENWQTYLKVLAIAVGIIAWALTAQATLERHIADQKDTVQLLMLICKNTAKPNEVVDCYEVTRK